MIIDPEGASHSHAMMLMSGGKSHVKHAIKLTAEMSYNKVHYAHFVGGSTRLNSTKLLFGVVTELLRIYENMQIPVEH